MTAVFPNQILTQQLLAAVHLAGDAIMNVYCETGKPVSVQIKEDQSPVTVADLAAHQVLTEQLRILTPELPVVSEEDAASVQTRLQHQRYWLIDPLDGTREYLSRNGEFTVNLALIDNHETVWGCVHAPALELTFWGGRHTGAFRRAQGQTSAVQVGPSAQSHAICRIIASKSHMDSQTQAFIEGLGPSSLVQSGSSLKFCRIAEGEADIYPRLGPTCEWDTAAAQAILEAAGGFVHDLQGQSLRYGKSDILNPYFIASRPGITTSWHRITPFKIFLA